MSKKGLGPFVGIDPRGAAVSNADSAGKFEDFGVTAQQIGRGTDTFDHVDLTVMDGSDPVVMPSAKGLLTLKHTEKDRGGGISSGISGHIAHIC